MSSPSGLEPTPPESDEVTRRILKMFEDWGRSFDSLRQSIVDNFSAECVWENPGYPPAVGPQGAIDLCLDPPHLNEGLETIKVTVVHITHQGRLVWTERLDDLLDADGTLILSAWVAGIMELDDEGRIHAWREYSKRVPK
jgi:limonene-1,2-epoxide hydrolase